LHPFLFANNRKNFELDGVVINLAQSIANFTSSKKKIKLYELNLCFQNSWATKFPWVKFIVRVDGKVTHVKCKVCNVIEG